MITRSKPSSIVQKRPWSYSKVFNVNTDGPPDKNGWINNIALTNVTVPGDTITYENSNKREFNYCLHTKDKVTLSENAGYGRLWTKSGTSGPNEYRLFMGCRSGPTRPNIAPAVVQVTSEMRRRAWQQLVPELNTGFSLFNFLWELKDFPQLIASVGRFLFLIKKYKIAQLMSTKTAAELQLNYSFAIVPLMSDIMSINALSDSLRKQVNEFRERGKKPQSFHYREDLGTTTIMTGRGYWGTMWFRTTTAMYYATLRCRYTYEEPSLFNAFRRLWGLRLTPEALWNAVPFSFLVDWVVDISRFLHQFDPDPCLTIEIIDYCDTVKSTVEDYEIRDGGPDWVDRNNFNYDGHTPSGQAGHRNMVVWKWTRSRYERTPGLPDTGYAFPVLDSLSMRELVLAAALLRTI